MKNTQIGGITPPPDERDCELGLKLPESIYGPFIDLLISAYLVITFS